MAVLQKIREKSVLLIAVIGLSLFAFIIGGLLEGGINFSSRNVGSVNGHDIPTQDFLNKLQMLEQNQQASGGQANNMLWMQQVKEILLTEQFEKAGLRLGKDQLINVIKNHPNFAQNPQFLNEAGKFDINKFNVFLSQMKAQPQQWQAWLNYEEELEKYAKEQMYYNLVKGAMYSTNFEAKMAYKKEMDKAAFDFVTVPYTTVNDDQVKISDEEILSYVQKNAKQFKSDVSRIVEYVYVANKPSAEDEAAVKTQVEELLKPTVVFNKETNKNDTVPGFKTNKDLIAFVNANSDVPYDSTYYAKTELPQQYQEQLYNLPSGEVFGPYLFNNHYCLSKVINKKNITESVDASHILIAYKGASNAAPGITLTKEEAKAKADALLAQAQANPGSFATLAAENTDDPGSKNNGGKYEGIKKGQMVPPFEAFIFNNPVGKLGVVETAYGFHVMKVDNKTTKEAVQLATIAKTINSSEKTEDEAYAKATKFEAEAGSKDFSKLATELGLVSQPETKIGAFDDQLPGVEGSQSQAISWAYGKKTAIGDIKKFDSAEGHLIIKLKDINETGVMTASEARGMVEPILKNEKKAEIIRKKMSGATLEEVAKNSGVTIQNGEVTGGNPVVGFGNETKVAGAAFGLKPNTTSKLIDGTSGVFMVRTKAVTLAPELPNYNAYKSRVVTNNRNSVQGSVYSAIYQKADIKDNRASVLK